MREKSIRNYVAPRKIDRDLFGLLVSLWKELKSWHHSKPERERERETDFSDRKETIFVRKCHVGNLSVDWFEWKTKAKKKTKLRDEMNANKHTEGIFLSGGGGINGTNKQEIKNFFFLVLVLCFCFLHRTSTSSAASREHHGTIIAKNRNYKRRFFFWLDRRKYFLVR